MRKKTMWLTEENIAEYLLKQKKISKHQMQQAIKEYNSMRSLKFQTAIHSLKYLLALAMNENLKKKKRLNTSKKIADCSSH